MKARTALTALLLALCCTARADDTDRERERLAVYARQGDSQLAEAARKMGELYRKTGNGKVRADWIALLVRRGDRRQALAACPECRPGDYAPDELENLAKAARDEKQFDTALQLYQALQKSDPERKIGWLGGALTALDGNDYISAINQIALYRERFGNDADIAAAQSYMDNRIQNNETAVPSRKQQEANRRREAETAERDHILQQYRAAAERRDFAAQEQLISRHGKFFSAKDRLWLRHAKLADELRRARADGDRKRLEQVYDGLSKILRESEENSEIYSQAKRDRMAVLIALGRRPGSLGRLPRAGAPPRTARLCERTVRAGTGHEQPPRYRFRTAAVGHKPAFRRQNRARKRQSPARRTRQPHPAYGQRGGRHRPRPQLPKQPRQSAQPPIPRPAAHHALTAPAHPKRPSEKNIPPRGCFFRRPLSRSGHG